jgi:hypothetical protein
VLARANLFEAFWRRQRFLCRHLSGPIE